ncbi:MAG: hypothetical protein H6825_15455 [Planctomycetes bacterium]|nr:hypothetical protein [Planctomycetota bacterium]
MERVAIRLLLAVILLGATVACASSRSFGTGELRGLLPGSQVYDTPDGIVLEVEISSMSWDDEGITMDVEFYNPGSQELSIERNGSLSLDVGGRVFAGRFDSIVLGPARLKKTLLLEPGETAGWTWRFTTRDPPPHGHHALVLSDVLLGREGSHKTLGTRTEVWFDFPPTGELVPPAETLPER